MRGIVGGRIKTQRGNFYSRFTDSVAGDCQKMMTSDDYGNFVLYKVSIFIKKL